MTTFDSVAEIHPRVRRDVLFTETPQGVLFHNSKGGFHINSASAYKFASLVVPHLDGRHSVAELGGGLSDPQKGMLATLVGTLLDRGFARHAGPDDVADAAATLGADVATAFAEQLGYIDHYSDTATERFARFRSASIAVVGTGEVAAWCVSGLLRNGAADVRAESTTCQDEQVLRAIGELDSHEVSTSPSTLNTATSWADLGNAELVVVCGTNAAEVVGWLERDVPTGSAVLPAWCIDERLVMGPLVEAGSETTWTSAVGLPAAPVVGPMAAMVGNHLAYEAFRLLTECLPAESREGLIIQDVASLDTTAERILTDPAAVTTSALPEASDLDWTPMDPDYDATSHEGDADDDPIALELNGRSVLVQPYTGLIAEFDDDGWRQSPLKVSSATYRPTRSDACEIVVADVNHVAAARLRLLDEVVGRHVERAADLPGLVPATEDTVSTARLYVAHPVAAAASADAVQARLLADGATVRIPVGAIQPGGQHDTSQAFTATPAGRGAAGTFGAALVRGLASALSHAAVVEAIGGGRVATLDVAALASGDQRVHADLTFLLRSADLLETDVEALLLPTPGAVAPTVLVRSSSHREIYAVATALSHAQATRAALVAVLGAVQVRADGRPGQLALQRPLIDRFDPWTLAPRGAAEPAEVSDWTQVVSDLDGAGISAAAVRTTTRDTQQAGVESATVVLIRAEATA